MAVLGEGGDFHEPVLRRTLKPACRTQDGANDGWAGLPGDRAGGVDAEREGHLARPRGMLPLYDPV